MKLELQFKDYLASMAHRANEPLLLRAILEPFGILVTDAGDSADLLMGHLLDDLAEHFNPTSVIDPVDVTQAAAELGHEPSAHFCAIAPSYLAQILSTFASNSH